MPAPTVSIIMANYNGAAFLAAALQSVLAQSRADIEVILADDASIDESVNIAQEIAAKDRRLVVLETAQNAGPAAARNRALDVARGEWVGIVDSDDIIHPHRLASMLDAATALDVDGLADDLTYFHNNVVRAKSTLLGDDVPSGPLALTPDHFVDDVPVAPRLGYLKPLLRRKTIGNLRYREGISIAEDHDFYVRFMLEGGRLQLIPQSYYLYRRHRNSLSHRLTPQNIRDMIRAQADLPKTYPDLSSGLRAKFEVRQATLERTMAFETTVRHIKGGKVGAALGAIARQPSIAVQLAGVAKSRALRLLRDPDDATPDDVVKGATSLTVAQWLSRQTASTTRSQTTAKAKGPDMAAPLVHVRTPTYKRPDALRRCLESLIAQNHQNWICDVFDDDVDGSAQDVVQALDDPRIRFHLNNQRLFGSKNIDQCFTRDNPYSAEYFFVLEDDNYVLPRFMSDNIAICQNEDVQIVFRNQLIEFQSGTDGAHLSKAGILDAQFKGGRYSPDMFRLCLMADIGVSNGGVFLSRRAGSVLVIHYAVPPTLQEDMCTFSIREPIYRKSVVWGKKVDLGGSRII